MLIRHAAVTACVFLAVLAAPAAVAQTVYIYEDEDGITHLTDRRPDTDAEVRIQRAVAQPNNPLEMVNRGSDRDPRWVFINQLHGPLQVEVDIDGAQNVVTDPELPARFVIPPAGEAEPVMVGPLEEGRSWRYRIQSRAAPGDPDAQPDRGFAYQPPFASGESFPVGQAFGGTHSHTEPHSRHAVDFPMPVGTPVHAARDGVVMDTEQYFHGAGSDRERHGERANFVRIVHSDGTMGVYAHLDYEGVHVRPGQRVRAGDRIGSSGNTGYSTGPHLHFVIQRNAGMRLESVPFRFAGQDRPPRPGERLRHQPGG